MRSRRHIVYNAHSINALSNEIKSMSFERFSHEVMHVPWLFRLLTSVHNSMNSRKSSRIFPHIQSTSTYSSQHGRHYRRVPRTVRGYLCTGDEYRNCSGNNQQRRHRRAKSAQNQNHQAQATTSATPTGSFDLQERASATDWNNLQHLVQQMVWRRSRRCRIFQTPSQRTL